MITMYRHLRFILCISISENLKPIMMNIQLTMHLGHGQAMSPTESNYL